jgi:predicted transcriptional regulator
VKGRLVTAYFVDNEIRKIVVNGNAESLYYIRDDADELIGIDKAVAALLYIIVENNEFKSVTYINGASAVTYPETEIAKPDLKLKGFKLQTDRKPLCKEDVFIRD